MNMTNQQRLLSLAALTALVGFCGIAKADDYSLPNTESFGRSEDLSQPMTCAQARAYAWFMHQLELGEGAADPAVATPAECQRDFIATTDAAQADSGVYEESK
jgi:hypothetical protein